MLAKFANCLFTNRGGGGCIACRCGRVFRVFRLDGILDNGFTYYLRSNDSPAEAVAMRLVINAGAVLDPAGQESIAHFLEHMLFNGTESFTKEELKQKLRDIGIDFGPDLNVYTTPDETVYIHDNYQLDKQQ